tara:strand:- start:94 stop:828 length:735 start_codon:yes stop_codon:yes gene_type:complete
MSYQELPYTHGKKTLKQINDMTGMVEGDTVFNITWGLIEIYSGTNWTNSQSVEMYFVKENISGTTAQKRFSKMPPVPGLLGSNTRVACPDISGSNNDEQNGYYVMQCRDSTADIFRDEGGLVCLADATADQDRGIGLTIRGTSNSGSEENELIVVAFQGNWNGYVTPNTNSSSGSSLDIEQGFFAKISTDDQQAGMLDDSFSTVLGSGNAGPTMEGKTLAAWPASATSPPARNIQIQIQHTEVI